MTVDVGIVGYRSRDLLEVCLRSLREHAPGRVMNIVVIDNDSRDGTVEMVRGFQDVALVEAGRNLGFAAATNIAIRGGRGAYFLALNPDTRLHTGTLDTLLELMDHNPAIGICGPRLELEDGRFDHAAKRSFPTPLGALAHFTRVGRREGAGTRLAQYRAPGVVRGPVDAVSGAFMLIRRTALEEIGLFDEGYWMYMEDLDLCYRAARAGWVTWYEPSVAVTHVKSGTSGRHRRFRVNHAFHYGMYRFYRTWYAPAHPGAYNLAIYGAIGAKFATSVAWSALNRKLVRRTSRMRVSRKTS